MERKFHFVGSHTSEEFSRAYGMDMTRPSVSMYKEVLMKLFSNEKYTLVQGGPEGKVDEEYVLKQDVLNFDKDNTRLSVRVDIPEPYDKKPADGSVFWFTVSGTYYMTIDVRNGDGMKNFYDKFNDMADDVGSILMKKFLPKAPAASKDSSL